MSTEVRVVSAPDFKVAVQFAAKSFVNNAPVLLAASAIMMLAQFCSTLVNASPSVQGTLNALYTSLFIGGLLRITLACHDGQPRLSMLFSQIRQFWKYLVAHLIYGFLVTAGLIMLVVPGVIFAVRMPFFYLAIAEKNLGPIAAVKFSWSLTEGKVLRLLGFSFLFFLMIVVPVAIFGVGVGVASLVLRMMIGQATTAIVSLVMAVAMIPLIAFSQLVAVEAYKQLEDEKLPLEVRQVE